MALVIKLTESDYPASGVHKLGASTEKGLVVYEKDTTEGPEQIQRSQMSAQTAANLKRAKN